METFVDCGGPNALPCRVGETCLIARDCQSKHCSNGICIKETCGDSIRNGDEVDVDCGGSRCSRCIDGKTCNVHGDCQNQFCRHYITSTCKPADCGDSIMNGDETCVDGGGSCGATCSDGATCLTNSDCLNDKCESQLCVPASCSDSIFQISTESDVDCGKSCAPCVNTFKCVTNLLTFLKFKFSP